MYKPVAVLSSLHLYATYTAFIAHVGSALKLNTLLSAEKYFLGVSSTPYYVRECFTNIVLNLETVSCLKYLTHAPDGRGKLAWSLKTHLTRNKPKMH